MSEIRLKAFGQAIRKFRQERGISQEDFAHLAKLDRSYIGQIERGERNITLSKVFQISDALGIPSAKLFELVP